MNFDIKKKLYFLILLLMVTTSVDIYAAAKQSASKEPQYSINLMWINQKLDNEQRYIFPLSKTDFAKNQSDLQKYKADLDTYKAVLEKKSLDTYKGMLDHYKLALWKLYQFLALNNWACRDHSWKLDCCKNADLSKVNLVAYKAALDIYKKIIDTYKTEIDINEDFPEKYNDQHKRYRDRFKIDKKYLDEAKALVDCYKADLEQYKINLDTYKSETGKAGLSKANLDAYKDYLIKTDLDRNFLNHIYKWAEINQGSVINVWFDSVVTSPEAVKNTQALIEDYAQKHSQSAQIKLRDIRKLPKVNEHQDVFSDKIPVYFRVDLLRPIMALAMVSTHETSYFVYADIDTVPLSREQLFDNGTLLKLKKYGIVMTYTDGFFENSFQIVSNDNRNLLESMEYAVLELNIQRAYNALKGRFGAGKYPHPKNVQESLMALEQVAYFSYQNMFLYFYYLEKRYPLKVCKSSDGIGSDRIFDKDGFTNYDNEKDGLTPFGLYESPAFEQWLILGNSSVTDDIVKTEIPVKMVHSPPSRFDFLNKHI